MVEDFSTQFALSNKSGWMEWRSGDRKKEEVLRKLLMDYNI